MSNSLDAYFSVGKKVYVRGHGAEYSMACPYGCGASDAFKIWPDDEDIPGVGTLGAFCCLGQNVGRHGCGRGGDGIKLLREAKGMSFREACEALGVDPAKVIAYWQQEKGLPAHERRASVRKRASTDVSLADRSGEHGNMWRSRANAITQVFQRYLYTDNGHEAFTMLHERGLLDTSILDAELGYSPRYLKEDATKWGHNDSIVRIPRGLVIPWRDASGRVVCIRFRRLPSDESDEAREFYGVDDKGNINRYRVVRGSSTSHLYREATITPACDVAIFEGELDALVSAQQAQGDLSVVATGSTSWGRSEASVSLLNGCTVVLVCYDANEAGDKASEYWLEQVRCAKVWRPLWGDANEMHVDGLDLRQWLRIGLGYFPAPVTTSTNEDVTVEKDERGFPKYCSVEGCRVTKEYLFQGRWYCSRHSPRKMVIA